MSLLVFLGNIVARALGFLFPIIVARAATRSDFATVYFFIATGFFVSELVLTGYPTALTRSLAAETVPAAHGSWFSSALLGGAPLLAVSLLMGGIFSAVVDESPVFMSFVVIGLTIDAYYFSLLRGLQLFKWLVSYRIGANVGQLLLVLATVGLHEATVPVLVTVYSFVYLVPIVIIELVARPLRTLVSSAARPTRSRVRDLTRFAIPSLISGTAYAAIFGLDVFYVRLLAPAALPDYAAARSLTVPLILLPFSVGTVLMPRVAGATDAERRLLLKRSVIGTAVVGVAGVAAYVLLSSALVGLVFPSGYAAAATIASYLAPAIGVLAVYSTLSQWWLGVGRPVAAATSIGIGALGAGAAQLALTPAHGAAGAAAAVTIGIGTSLVVLAWQTVRLLRAPVSRTAPE
jgi:O-antigen/teichoic acid export membrane protein